MNDKPIVLKQRRNEASRERWRENREAAERTLRKRQDRYANDPEYRDSIKESVRKRRANEPKSNRTRSFNRDRIITLGDKHVTLWSSGKCAYFIGIARRTLTSWENKQVIPVDRLTDSLGRRWYPSAYVLFIAEMFAKREPKEKLNDWAIRVKEEWDKRQLGVHRIPVVNERTLGDGEHSED